MDKINNKNGLTLVELYTYFEPCRYEHCSENIDEIIKEKLQCHELEFSEAYIISYLDYCVFIGKFNKGELIFYDDGAKLDLKYLQKLRVFNKNFELLLWKKSDSSKCSLNGRLRIDNGDDKNGYTECHATDSDQALFGERLKALDSDWIKLTEGRGTEIIMPKIPCLSDLAKLDGATIFIQTRNYIDVHKETHHSYYSDYRLVNFVCKYDRRGKDESSESQL